MSRVTSGRKGQSRDDSLREQIRKLALALEAEEKKRKAIVSAARTLLSAMTLIEASEEYQAVWVMSQIHRGPYKGENWANERSALIHALVGVDD